MAAGRAYCLRCFAPVARGASSRCARCGFVNLAGDRRVYWNRAPLLRRIEGALKLGVLLATIAATFVVATSVHGVRMGAGYVMATPLIPGIMAWRTVSKLTRHHTNFHAVAVWCAILCACGFATVWMFGALLTSRERLAVLGGTALACSLVQTAGVLLRRWKLRLTRG